MVTLANTHSTVENRYTGPFKSGAVQPDSAHGGLVKLSTLNSLSKSMTGIGKAFADISAKVCSEQPSNRFCSDPTFQNFLSAANSQMEPVRHRTPR